MKPATLASFILAVLIVALVWGPFFWLLYGPAGLAFPDQLIFALQCCALVPAVVLLILPGAGLLKAVFLIATGAFFSATGADAIYFAPLSAHLRDLLIGLCIIATIAGLVRPYLLLGLRRSWPALDQYTERVDAREAAVYTAVFTLTLWMVAYSLWLLVAQHASNPIAWVPRDAAFIMVALGCQCLVGGTPLLPVDVPRSPEFTFLSSREVERVQRHLDAGPETASRSAPAQTDDSGPGATGSTAA